MPSRANYSIVTDSVDFLVIQDLGPWSNFPTVTNDAEAVVEELALRLNGRRLYYYDSDGSISELLVTNNGEFNGFAAGSLQEVTAEIRPPKDLLIKKEGFDSAQNLKNCCESAMKMNQKEENNSEH